MTENPLISKVKPLSDEAIQRITQCEYLTVWEGPVRSGKTVEFLLAFMNYILFSTETVFLLTGATMGTVSRNCINGEFGFLALSAGVATTRTDSDGSKFIQWFDKIIYYMGADNSASYKKVQGLTIGGWAADEFNLHDKTFITQAFSRSIASFDRKNFGTLNPEPPNHFIYTDYLDKYEMENLPGFRLHHTTLDNNPALSEERKNELKAQYTGVFYKRYILGLRVRAEGIIYVSFTHNEPGEKGNVIEKIPEDWKILFVQVGVDIGGTASATHFNATGFFRTKHGKLAIVILDEDYDDINKDVETVKRNFKLFITRVKKSGYRIAEVRVDSAEQLILKSLRAMNIADVMNSIKKPIVDRIRLFDLLFSQERAYILRKCKYSIEAFETALWKDKNSGDDERLDDGTTKVDPLDGAEYAVEPYLSDLVEAG